MVSIHWKRVNQTELDAGWCQPLYEQKAAGLLLYGRALGLSHAEAEDVLQETFLAMLKMERAPEEPEHYCVRCFRNRALNYHRGVWRRIARELEAARWFEARNDPSEHEAEAMRGLANLPPEQREAIVLKLWNDMTFEAIGRLLDISPNTVAGRYRYGLNKLKLCFKEENYARDRSIRKAVAILDSASSVG